MTPSDLPGNYVYSLPVFNKTNGLAHSLLGGWQVAGTFIDESGAPAPALLAA